MGFVVGCGRSGTTVLGDVIGRHPGAEYLFEPYHLWWAIDERLDVNGLYSGRAGRWFFDAADATEEMEGRFRRVMGSVGRPGAMLVEKTPHNVARIGLLERLAPGSQYVHIVRNGLSVVESIERLATMQPYRLAFMSDYNQWWGTRGAKWEALSAEGHDRGYFGEEVGQLRTDAQRGAYEWIVSIGEADRWREALGERLLEVTYTELTERPREVLERVREHLGLGREETWLAEGAGMLMPERAAKDVECRLPRRLCERFNELQARWGFAGRAEVLEGGSGDA